MATEEVRVPGPSTRAPVASRAGAALVIVAVLMAGVVLGRVTSRQHAPTVGPKPLLVELGPRSVGDLRRTEMFEALNH